MDGNESEGESVVKNERKAAPAASERKLQGKATDSESTSPESHSDADNNTETRNEEKENPEDHTLPGVPLDTKPTGVSIQKHKDKFAKTLDEDVENIENDDTTKDGKVDLTKEHVRAKITEEDVQDIGKDESCQGVEMVITEHVRSGSLKEDDKTDKLPAEVNECEGSSTTKRTVNARRLLMYYL